MLRPHRLWVSPWLSPEALVVPRLRQAIAGNPVVNDLEFITIEDAKHRGLFTRKQLPEPTILGRLVATDPTGVLERFDEIGHLPGFTQPLGSALAANATVIGVQVRAYLCLGRQDVVHLLFDIEIGNDVLGAIAQRVEPVAITDATVESLFIAQLRHRVEHRLDRFGTMPS